MTHSAIRPQICRNAWIAGPKYGMSANTPNTSGAVASMTPVTTVISLGWWPVTSGPRAQTTSACRRYSATIATPLSSSVKANRQPRRRLKNSTTQSPSRVDTPANTAMAIAISRLRG